MSCGREKQISTLEFRTVLPFNLLIEGERTQWVVNEVHLEAILFNTSISNSAFLKEKLRQSSKITND